MILNKMDLDLTSSEVVLTLCFQLGLVCGTRNCEKCDSSMNLHQFTCADGFLWECSKKNCRKRTSVRKLSIFENSKLSLGLILSLLWNFANRIRAETSAKSFGVRLGTVQKWYSEFRQKLVFFYEIEKEFIEIGGPNKTVEIDESMLGKRKYNKGRLRNQVWVFGGVERENKSNWFVEIVERRNGDTLLPIIEKKIANGSTVMSDGWRAYRNLSQDLPNKSFIHKWVNHEVEFVSRIDRNVHTQNIECFWSILKRFLRNSGTNYRRNLTLFLAEHYFRTKHAEKFFEFLISLFKAQ